MIGRNISGIIDMEKSMGDDPLMETGGRQGAKVVSINGRALLFCCVSRREGMIPIMTISTYQ